MSGATSSAHAGLSPVGVTWLGMFVNVALAVAKLGVGIVFHAQALVADGLHSISDLVTDGAVLAGLVVSGKPADHDHHYGHRRVTTLVTLFVGGALLVTAAWIMIHAILTYGEPHGSRAAWVPFIVAAACILPKELLYRITRAVGLRVGDASVIANAWHHRTDAFTSIAAAAGLAGVAIGGPAWAFLDHLTAAVLSAFLGVAAVRFIHDSLTELIDAAPDQKTTGRIAETVSTTPGVADYHHLRIRRVGGSLALDVHVHVDGSLSVVEGHDIAEEVHDRVLACGCDVVEAVVHVEPVMHVEPEEEGDRV